MLEIRPLNNAALRARHIGWGAPESFPDAGAPDAPHHRIRLTNRRIIDQGRPVVPVTGELHFTRVPRARWRRRLQQMKAGGITAVSTYVIWIHHQPVRRPADFTGGRDLRAFLELCNDLGLAAVLRIGPWVHGEVRNGGLPDWVQHSGTATRTDDPGYLRLVTDWFDAIGTQVADICRAGETVIAIQLDNELYDQPEHLRTLKSIAAASGLLAPVYSATARGSAQLPVGELLPLFGGYGDGFWVPADDGWDDGFRDQFFFSHSWDAPGIGADRRTTGHTAANPAEPHRSGFPPATCELGGGMGTGPRTAAVVVLPFDIGLDSWVFDEPVPRLFRSASPIWSDGCGALAGEAVTAPDVAVLDPSTGTFLPVPTTWAAGEQATVLPVRVTAITGAQPSTGRYGVRDGRASAPRDEDYATAARFAIHAPARPLDERTRGELVLKWEGDVARLLADGTPVADRFWDGTDWSIDLDLDLLGAADRTMLELQILPLHPDSAIWLPEDARQPRRPRLEPRLEPRLAVHSAVLRVWAAWEERAQA